MIRTADAAACRLGHPVVRSELGMLIRREMIQADRTYVVSDFAATVRLVVGPDDKWEIEAIRLGTGERMTFAYEGGMGAEAICRFVDLVRKTPSCFAFNLRENGTCWSMMPIRGGDDQGLALRDLLFAAEDIETIATSKKGARRG